MVKVKTMKLSNNERTNTFVSYIDFDDRPVLKLFRSEIHDDNYFIPAVTIAINGAGAIKNLYQLLVLIDAKYDLNYDDKEYRSTRNFTCGTYFINELLIADFTNGELLLLEADSHNEHYYKPSKQIKLSFDKAKKLFNLLKNVHQESTVKN